MGLCVGSENGGQAEPLRGLHKPQALPVYRMVDQTSGGEFHCVGDRQPWHNAFRTIKLGDDVADQVI